MLLSEFILYSYPHVVHAVIITAAVTTMVFTGLYFIEKSVERIAYKMFQNLNFYVIKIIATIWILSYLITSHFFQESAVYAQAFYMCFGTMILILKHKVDALDDEMRDAFNHGKSWWDVLWGRGAKVEEKYLNKEMYEKLVAKIKAEYETNGMHIEAIVKLMGDLKQTLEIIDNINEIFRKMIQGETTMLSNKELLHSSYKELEGRYKYLELHYLELLRTNYGIRHPIEM